MTPRATMVLAAATALVPAMLPARLPAQLPAPRAAATTPLEPASLPPDWGQRDLDGKWVAYRRAVDGAPQDTTMPPRWALALGAAGEHELLEAIVLHEGWRHFGKQLEQNASPQLLRAALWNLGAYDSHDHDTAEKALVQRGPETLAWLLAHPHVVRGKVAALRDKLVQAKTQPAARQAYLPPLDPMQVLVPMLDAPAGLAEFGDRLRAEPGVRYVHQVLRALGGVLVYGEADDLVVQKVLRLAGRAHPAVRQQAFHTLTKLPSGLVPHAGLQKLADDPGQSDAQRQLATLALSFSVHPTAFFRVFEIANDAAHPGRLAALRRLGEIADAATVGELQRLQELHAEDGPAAQALAAALATYERRRAANVLAQVAPVQALAWRTAWLRWRQDGRAAAHTAALRATLQPLVDPGTPLSTVLERYLAADASTGLPSPFRGEEERQVQQELLLLVREFDAAK